MNAVKLWLRENWGRLILTLIVILLILIAFNGMGWLDPIKSQFAAEKKSPDSVKVTEVAPPLDFQQSPKQSKPPKNDAIKDACEAGAKKYFESDSAGETLGKWLRLLAGKPAKTAQPAAKSGGANSCTSQEADIGILRGQRNECRKERDACTEGENQALKAKERENANLRRDIDAAFKIIYDFANNRVPPQKQQEIRSLYSCPEGTGMIRVETDDEIKIEKIFFSNDPEKKWRKVDDFQLIMGFCWNIKDPFTMIVELAEGEFIEGPAEDDGDDEESSPTLAIPLNVAVNLRSLSHDVTNEDILADPATINGVEYWAVQISFNH